MLPPRVSRGHFIVFEQTFGLTSAVPQVSVPFRGYCFLACRFVFDNLPLKVGESENRAGDSEIIRVKCSVGLQESGELSTLVDRGTVSSKSDCLNSRIFSS